MTKRLRLIFALSTLDPRTRETAPNSETLTRLKFLESVEFSRKLPAYRAAHSFLEFDPFTGTVGFQYFGRGDFTKHLCQWPEMHRVLAQFLARQACLLRAALLKISCLIEGRRCAVAMEYFGVCFTQVREYTTSSETDDCQNQERVPFKNDPRSHLSSSQIAVLIKRLRTDNDSQRGEGCSHTSLDGYPLFSDQRAAVRCGGDLRPTVAKP